MTRVIYYKVELLEKKNFNQIGRAKKGESNVDDNSEHDKIISKLQMEVLSGICENVCSNRFSFSIFYGGSKSCRNPESSDDKRFRL